MPYYSGSSCIERCTNQETFYWIFTDLELTPGVSCLTSDNCLTISGQASSSVTYVLPFGGNFDGVVSCYRCLDKLGRTFNFKDCNTGEVYPIRPGLLNDFGLIDIPQLDCVYYMSFFYIMKGGFGQTISSCFYLYSVEKIGSPYGVNIIYSFSDSYGSVFDGNCTTCLNNITYVYRIRPCLTPESPISAWFIETSIQFEQPTMITAFLDGIEEPFCCEIDKQSFGNTPNATILQILGPTDKKGPNCQTCNESLYNRRILYDCVNPENQIVVWGSPSFENGDVTHLSLSGLCWTVGDITESAATVTEFAEFTPSPKCEDCIKCYGVTLELYPCGGSRIPIYIDVFDYVDLGRVIRLPYSGDGYQCYVVSGISENEGIHDTFYSVLDYTNCEDCIAGFGDIESFYATKCSDGSTIIFSTYSGSVTSGDYVRLNWGTSEVDCAEIIGLWDGSFTNESFYFSQLAQPFTDCSDCLNNGYVGVTLIKCDNTEQQYVTVSLNLYSLLIGLYPVIYFGSTCWRLSNDCPIDTTYDYVSSIYLYNNCIECNQPKRVGQEYELCLIDCSGNTYTMSVEHPIWTDLQGQSVIQMGAIELGGKNGYYS